MFFGLGPFGLGFNFGQQAPQPQQPNNNNNGFFQNGQHPFNFNQNLFGFGQQPPQNPPQQQPNNGGIFNQFLNFMNPQFQNNNNRRNQPPEEQPPRPSFFRRNQKQEKNQRPHSMSKKQPINNPNTGIYWKNKGNQAYQAKHYQQAIEHYTKAIQLNNTESIFFSNRAQTYKKLGRVEDTLKDAQQAIELDSTNARGHILAGQCLAELGKREDNPRKLENAITRLTKALTLCGGKKLDLQKQASRYIYLAKKILFYLEFAQLRNARLQALQQYRDYLQRDESLSNEAKENKLRAFLNASDEKILFSIPDYLQCKITFDLMEDPVITDSGQTYERFAIEEHIERNGRTDPFTRQPIKGPLYPAVAIRKAVQDFLERNPWAYEFSEGENYKDIQF